MHGADFWTCLGKWQPVITVNWRMQARVGSATTPHLQVAPLFAIHGLPKTPMEGCASSSSRLL